MGQAGPPKPWSWLQRKSWCPTQQPLYSAAATPIREIASYRMIWGFCCSVETAVNMKYPTMFLSSQIPSVKTLPVYNSQKWGLWMVVTFTLLAWVRVLPTTCLMHWVVQIGLAHLPVHSLFVPSAFQEELSSASPCLSQQIAILCAFPQETDGKERRGRHLRCTVAVSEGAGWWSRGLSDTGASPAGRKAPTGTLKWGVRGAYQGISIWCSGEDRRKKWAWWSDRPH